MKIPPTPFFPFCSSLSVAQGIAFLPPPSLMTCSEWRMSLFCYVRTIFVRWRTAFLRLSSTTAVLPSRRPPMPLAPLHTLFPLHLFDPLAGGLGKVTFLLDPSFPLVSKVLSSHRIQFLIPSPLKYSPSPAADALSRFSQC